jgi:hypothetical protein
VAPKAPAPQARDFSNGLKNPTDDAFSVGFFYLLEIF